jgi:hypothetical protein
MIHLDLQFSAQRALSSFVGPGPVSVPDMGDTGSAGVFKVAAPSCPRFARIAAVGRILRISRVATQLPEPRCDHDLRTLRTLVCAAVATAQAKSNDSNLGQAEQQ